MPFLLALEAHELPLLVPELFSRGVSTWLGEAKRKRAVPTAGSSTAIPPWRPGSLCSGSECRTARGTDRLLRVRREFWTSFTEAFILAFMSSFRSAPKN